MKKSRVRNGAGFFVLRLATSFFVTIRNQPSYAGKKISRVTREIFCNNKEASA